MRDLNSPLVLLVGELRVVRRGDVIAIALGNGGAATVRRSRLTGIQDSS